MAKFILKDFDRFQNKQIKNVDALWVLGPEGHRYLDYGAMIEELHRFTHLPKWVCKAVYDAEEAILIKLGIMKV